MDSEGFVLLKLGRDSGSYENLAEGYINCIRILKEDNLKFYVLQYYEDFVRRHQDDAGLQADLAAAYLRVGEITDQMQYAFVVPESINVDDLLPPGNPG